MRAREILSAVSVLAMLSASGTAWAADDLIDAPEITIDAPEVTIASAKASQGFYIRSDLGYAGWTDAGDLSIGVSDGFGGYDDTGFDDARFSKPVSGSIGIGYQINDMVRADLTGDYFEGRFDGSVTVPTPCGGEGAGTSCTGNGKSRYSAIGLMANAYADLGTISGITPYLGAGLGATRLSWGDVSLSTRCVDTGGGCSGAGDASASVDGADSWRFTYALMAGLSYDLTERLKFDLGYRYSHIAGGDLFGGAGLRGEDDGFGRHEVRAGLRLSLY